MQDLKIVRTVLREEEVKMTAVEEELRGIASRITGISIMTATVSPGVRASLETDSQRAATIVLPAEDMKETGRAEDSRVREMTAMASPEDRGSQETGSRKAVTTVLPAEDMKETGRAEDSRVREMIVPPAAEECPVFPRLPWKPSLLRKREECAMSGEPEMTEEMKSRVRAIS